MPRWAGCREARVRAQQPRGTLGPCRSSHYCLNSRSSQCCPVQPRAQEQLPVAAWQCPPFLQRHSCLQPTPNRSGGHSRGNTGTAESDPELGTPQHTHLLYPAWAFQPLETHLCSQGSHACPSWLGTHYQQAQGPQRHKCLPRWQSSRKTLWRRWHSVEPASRPWGPVCRDGSSVSSMRSEYDQGQTPLPQGPAQGLHFQHNSRSQK